MTIELPPLRARTRDIKDLAMHYMVKLCERHGTETKGFSPDFFDALFAYDWPGNVRELINTMERMPTIARFEPTLFPRHLPTQIRVYEARASVRTKTGSEKKSEEDGHPAEMLPKLKDVRESELAPGEKKEMLIRILPRKRTIRIIEEGETLIEEEENRAK